MAFRPLVAQLLPTPLSLLSVPVSPVLSILLFVPLTGNFVPASKPLHLLSSLLGVLLSLSPHKWTGCSSKPSLMVAKFKGLQAAAQSPC